MLQLIQGGKLLTRLIARKTRRELVKISLARRSRSKMKREGSFF